MMTDLSRWLRFNLWYFGRPPWDTQVTPPELVDFVAQHPPGRALDLGCGSGTNLAYLAQAGWQVSGVDFALKAVEAARRRLQRAGLAGDVRVGDVTHLERIPGPFELVLDIGCYHSLNTAGRERYRAALERLVASGGSFLIYAHLKASTDSSIGLEEKDIDEFTRQMRLIWRADSLERGKRQAVWMEFER